MHALDHGRTGEGRDQDNSGIWDSDADRYSRTVTISNPVTRHRKQTQLLLRRRKPVILKALAQGGFLYLAGRRVGNFVNEHHVVGYPPIGDLAADIAENVVPADRF